MERTAARHARFAEGIAAKYRNGGRRTRKLTELAHRLGLQSVGDRGTAAGRGAAAASMRGGFWPHATAMRLAAANLKRDDAGRRQLTGASLGVSGALRDSGEGSASLGFRIGGAAGGSLDRAGLPRIVEQLSGASLMRLAAPAAQAASLGGGGMIVPAMRLAAMMPGRGPGKAAVQAESAARGGAHTAVEAAVPRGSRPAGMAHVEAVNAVGAGASAGAAVDRLAGAARAGGMVANAAKAGIGSAMEPAVHASAPSAGRAGEEGGVLPSAMLRLPAGLRLPLAGRPLAQAGASAARAAAVAHGAPAARLLGAARADAAAPAAALVGAAALAHGASAAASRTSAPAAPRTLARTIAAPREALAASPPPGAASAFAPMGAPRTLARANAAPREALAASPPNAAPAPRALSRLGAAPLAVAAPPAAPHAAAHSAPPPPVLAQRPAAPHAAASAPPALAHRAPAAAPSPPAPAAAAGPGQDAPSQGGFAASAPPPASQPQPAAVDLKALTEQVYQMLERKLRIEKQRKGL